MIQDFSGNDPSYGMGAASQIATFLSSIPGIAEKQAQVKSQDLQDQTKLYFSLRQQGYSKDDAAERVNRTYQSTNFVQNLLGGQSNEFQPSTDTDLMDMERAKAQRESDTALAEQQAKKAEALKFAAQADYYKAGGPAQRYAGNNNLTPNQIQMRIKDLRGQIGMGTPDEDSSINDEIGYLNDLFNKKSGYAPGSKPASTTQSGTVSPKFQAGQTVYYKGKPVKIKKVNDDGSYEI